MQSCLLNLAAAPVHARPAFQQQRLQQLGNCKLVQPNHRNVAAHGILDSFRKERGLPIPGQQGSTTQTIDKPQPRQPSKQQQAAADEEECPVECVTEVYTPEEFQQALQAAGPRTLVVVDFFKTACGACKFIYPGFVKMCRESASQQQQQQQEDSQPIVFLKHNVYDDDEGEVTALCKQYNVRSVPKFVFFKNGRQLESFSTRDKAKVADAILKHAEPGTIEFGDWVAE